MNSDLIKRDWHSRGYGFRVFRKPASQVWADFIHGTNELVVFAEGEIEEEIEGKAERFQIGEMVFIPAKEIWEII